MSRKLEKYRRVDTVIPDGQVNKDFQAFVLDKYGASRIVTGIELQKAMKYHLAMEGWKDYPDLIDEGVLIEKPDAHTHKIAPPDKILIQKIYSELQPGQEIHFEALRRWMTRDCGFTDRRTHKKHIDVLVVLGVLENAGDQDNPYHLYEVLEPNRDLDTSTEI